METKKSHKKSPFFSCKDCDYNTCKKCDYVKHLSTRKHDSMVTMEIEETKKSSKTAHHNMCFKCKKMYFLEKSFQRVVTICKAINKQSFKAKKIQYFLPKLKKF